MLPAYSKGKLAATWFSTARLRIPEIYILSVRTFNQFTPLALRWVSAKRNCFSQGQRFAVQLPLYRALHCTLYREKVLHGWWHVKIPFPIPVRVINLSPGILPDFSPQLRDKIWEWPRDKSQGYSSLRVYYTTKDRLLVMHLWYRL